MAWENAPTLNKLTASQQGGNPGAQLWGVDYKGTVHTIYQTTPGGEWSKWLGPDWAGPGYPKQVYELAASQVKEGDRIATQMQKGRIVSVVAGN